MYQYEITFRTADCEEIIETRVIPASSARVALMQAVREAGVSDVRFRAAPAVSFNVRIEDLGRVLRVVKREWHPSRDGEDGLWSFVGDGFILESEAAPEGWELLTTWKARRQEREA